MLIIIVKSWDIQYHFAIFAQNTINQIFCEHER